MTKRMLIRPPVVKQGEGFKCWAAALESWLAATPGRQCWTQDQLVELSAQYKRPGPDQSLPAGAINADIFKRMCNDQSTGIKMVHVEVPRGKPVDRLQVLDLLSEHWYLFISYTTPMNDVRHANVIWSADDEGYVSVMEPMRGAYMNKLVDEFTAPVLIGHRPYSLLSIE